MIDPNIIADYDGWLHKVANTIGNPEDHDDLVQEGRVAMWRALSSYDARRGSLPSWITRAAEVRMKDVAWGSGQPFGHEAVRGVREAEVVAHLDEDPGMAEALLGHVEDAYHDGEILEVIRSLPPVQQEYVFLRFWGGLDPRSRSAGVMALVAQFPTLGDRGTWQKARAALTERLGHLAA